MPTHVGIILDGNGRWATSRGLKRSEGHKAGFETLKKTARYILSKGVKYLSVFAFSTENFNRSAEEVGYLMNLFMVKFNGEIKYFNENNIKVVFSGVKEPLSDDVWNAMKKIERETGNNTGGVFNICLNYGGRLEIVEATKKIVQDVLDNKVSIDDINENMFEHYLFQELPPLDLLIRTGGEQRISNFMLYSAAYAEFYFTDTYFPDFDDKEFDKAINEYSGRDRRFGKIKNS